MGDGGWGMGDGGLGIGDWGLGPIPNPASPIPNPKSPKTKLNIINDKIPVYILINKKNIKDKFFIKENVCSFFKDDLNYVNVIETSARDNNNINNLFIQISKKSLGINLIENNDFA